MNARFDRYDVTYARDNGATPALKIETVVFEYAVMGGYCWLQLPALWETLQLKLYPGSAAMCRSFIFFKALIRVAFLLPCRSLVRRLAVPHLLWE